MSLIEAFVYDALGASSTAQTSGRGYKRFEYLARAGYRMQKRRTPPQDVLSAADEAWLHNLLRSCQLLGRHGHSATPRRSENERSRKEIEAGNKEEGLPAKPPYRSCLSNELPNRFPFSLGWIRCQCATESIVEYFESNGNRRKPPVSETQPKARRRGAGFSGRSHHCGLGRRFRNASFTPAEERTSRRGSRTARGKR